ncbi:MAG: DUF523 domain-containing protein [Deltaproteobacteria bacterium]
MAEERMMLSACLAGVRCVYDGSHKRRPALAALVRRKKAVLFCPEQLGGFAVPHPASEIRGGDGADVLAGRARVVSRTGEDVTELFLRGAAAALRQARKNGIRRAVMKARSPSCGCGKIYDGTFTRCLRDGDGVTAALLKKQGIEVVTDEEFLGIRQR